MNKHQGIEGLAGREPFGAVVTVGHKGDRGFPTDTDRFFIVMTTQDDKKVRPPHPAFAPFNNATNKDFCKVLYGNIVHASADEAFNYHLKAQVLGKAHPDMRPACVGDGKTAERWMGDDVFKTIPCPNDKCEFRTGVKPACKPFGRIAFRLRWKKEGAMPSPLVKLSTGSWNTVGNLLGFFDYIAAQARLLGVAQYSLYGLPFMLTVTRKTKPSQNKAFPVVTIAPDGDLQDFLWTQSDRMKELEGRSIAALTDGGYAEEHADLVTIEPGMPGRDG